MQLHLISDAPLGVFLSGGLDSNTIAALASRSSPGKARTLSVAFPELRFNEASVARAMSRALGTEHLELEVNAEHVVEALDCFRPSLDQPTDDGMNSFFVSEMARVSGLKVALSGLGGDEVFGGYPSFRAVPPLQHGVRWGRAIPGSRSLAHGVAAHASNRFAIRTAEALEVRSRLGRRRTWPYGASFRARTFAATCVAPRSTHAAVPSAHATANIYRAGPVLPRRSTAPAPSSCAAIWRISCCATPTSLVWPTRLRSAFPCSTTASSSTWHRYRPPSRRKGRKAAPPPCDAGHPAA